MALFGAWSDSCFVRRLLDYIFSGLFFLTIRAAYACWILRVGKVVYIIGWEQFSVGNLSE